MNTEIVKANKLDIDTIKSLERAADIIKSGGLVIFPTETVYGLGADATRGEAAEKIYKAKGRPSDNPLIIHISKPSDANLYTYTSALYERLSEAFMPGPLTVVLPSKETVPMQTRASLPTVAVRCPAHPIANKLIELAGVPIAAPSANISGSPSPTRVQHVIDDMVGRVDMIIDGGDCDFGLESTIVKIEDDETLTLLRPGKITIEDLSSVCSNIKVAAAVTDQLKVGEVALSPGMKYKHYAPSAPVYLLDGEKNEICTFISEKSKGQKIAVLSYKDYISEIKKAAPDAFIYEFGEREDESQQAHLLFDILRDADKKNFDEIYAPLPRASGVGLALYNRMIRAAAYHIIRL